MLRYKIEKNKIIIPSREEFVPQHILECGQVFSFSKEGDVYKVFPLDKYAEIIEVGSGYEIITKDVDFFVDYFDLKTDYSLLKQKLGQFNILKKPLKFGNGIRILKQDLFETVLSFIISANNNIKRIQLILGRLRERLGQKCGDVYAFPSYEKLKTQSEQFFKDVGAGYRASYLYKVLRQITPETLKLWEVLDTATLRKQLLTLQGVGPKVADCILLFGYGRGDVFPVDTWIAQMYNQYYSPLENREKIRGALVEEFGQLSGYAQQYLFYYQRSGQ
ncbi:MAG: hypothetical protein NC218_12345 [Acetobacter sp.]|nr:hypothetical protein [Acetobacter sp.]